MRSKLKESHLNDLMSIKLLSAPVPQFDPAEAIQLWNTSGSLARRPYFKDTNPGGKATGAIHAQAVNQNSRPPVQAVPVGIEEIAEKLADGDVSGAEGVDVELASKDDGSQAGPVEQLSRGDSCVSEEAEENVGAEENEEGDVVDTACDDSDGYDSGVDSDVEEKQVDSLISKYS